MNEDGMSLKSSNSVRKKRIEEKKFPFKIRFEKTLLTLKKIYSNEREKQIGLFPALCNKFNKLLMLIITLFMICFLFYFYTYWHLIPLIESSKPGFTLKFFKETNWEHSDYRKGILLFIIFNFIFLLFMISLLRTFFANPGYFEKEYVDLYSLIKFLKYMFTYFVKWRDHDFKFADLILNDKMSLIEDLDEIITKIEPLLLERMNEFSNSVTCVSRYNSIDVTKKNIYSEIEDYNDAKEKATVSQTLNEDILESFENEYNNFIRVNDMYSMLDKLQFYEKGKDSNRFCGFCLVKKPDRSHHCRQCKMCLRKMDHHCIFLYTCIAFENYKFFFLTLLYGCLLLFIMSFTLIDGLKFYINEFRDNSILTIYCITYFFILILTILLTYFFYLHFILLINNLTTIDYIEKGSLENKIKSNNIFSLGKFKNISLVMGNCFLWFLPITFESKNKGYSYEVDKDSYNQLLIHKIQEKEDLRNRNLLNKINLRNI